ncbi:MAG: RagB/SusD family nutrient uptake outer membrane protein [Arachidicoccus sp.]|nr:RagB/SusD family nutrient uptake outer membrane protein [Arachidicoccus sp.]
MNSVSSLLFLCAVLVGCKKYLDAKSDKKLTVPTTLQDMQSLLDYYYRVNNYEPGAGVTASDEYYLTHENYNSLTLETDRNVYLWNKDYQFPAGFNDWSYAYDNVYRANVVLDNLPGIERTASNGTDWDNIKGQALFLRGKSFLKVSYIWSLSYDSATASQDLGIPLRLNSDFNQVSVRTTVKQSYERILKDLADAALLLPDKPLHVLRSSKAAAYGLLARTYLSMRLYDSCLLYADKSLQISNTLLDYNTLDSNASYPIGQFNDEVVMENQIPIPPPPYYGYVDTSLYSLYDSKDLRKAMFFQRVANGIYSFKGSYEGFGNLFGGIATDELYLMRAECNARTGSLQSALEDLNKLLEKRYVKGSFVSVVSSSRTEIIATIVKERKKELLFRDLRWMDIKRLNKEDANISLTRSINGISYTLEPNDPRFAMSIPEDVISNSGMQQNPR